MSMVVVFILKFQMLGDPIAYLLMMGPPQLGNWAFALASHCTLVRFSGGHRFGEKGADWSVGVPFVFE